MSTSNDQPAANAISIYGQEGLDDFPVLKAFQQYIDAEQSKARKRMVMLCIFFGFLMTVVVTVFLFMLRDVNTKNQSLNDRLLEYVMKNNDRQPVVVQPPAAPSNNNDAALKAMTDTLAALQKQMADQQAKMAEQQAKMADQQIKAAQAASAAAVEAQMQLRAAAQTRASEGPTKEQKEIQRQIDEDTAKLVKARALLKAERAKIDAEKEKLRKDEIERQRRRLYPEYYEKLDGAKAAPKKEEPKSAAAPAKPKRPAAINYFDAYENEDVSPKKPEKTVPAAKPKPQPVAPAKPKPVAQVQAQPKPEPKAPARDHYSVPVEIGGTDGDWLIPSDEKSSVAK